MQKEVKKMLIKIEKQKANSNFEANKNFGQKSETYFEGKIDAFDFCIEELKKLISK